ncbi:5-oxoprolinase subunit PxpB [Cuneatibacter sp. NSJ-177]|uniref:5-oxoprolinase subunit PxpB n=1 Tax=Cuneatibacter sp. NSJ-177 TaxID=2931401 RepID=UPI001FD4E7D8|nr:5-oxoprolinase subunit PxpB [Cuneatibacter sp. NSJ-177]MCJ7837502.1 5-oxoprolinase subunit PxpB [Cuneatibacter sp. NSJ-177]
MERRIEYRIAGDCALTVVFGDCISEAVNQKVRALSELLRAEPIEGVSELVPAYCSLTVHYRPNRIGYSKLLDQLRQRMGRLEIRKERRRQIVELPVLYGGTAGPDLEYVARYHHLTVEEAIRLHTGSDYRIYMMGFTPGSAYLGGLAKELHTPRLDTPRVEIPAGSVSIAGNQAFLYAIRSPGGHRLVGRTPVRLFAPEREQPFLLMAGQVVRFAVIDAETYREIEEEERNGRYHCRTWEEVF